MKVVIG